MLIVALRTHILSCKPLATNRTIATGIAKTISSIISDSRIPSIPPTMLRIEPNNPKINLIVAIAHNIAAIIEAHAMFFSLKYAPIANKAYATKPVMIRSVMLT